MRGIQLRSVTATVRGDLNLLGVLGADPDVRNGFSAIWIHFAVDADASPSDIEALVAQSQKRSAVFDAVANPTEITVTVNVPYAGSSRDVPATPGRVRRRLFMQVESHFPRFGGTPRRRRLVLRTSAIGH